MNDEGDILHGFTVKLYAEALVALVVLAAFAFNAGEIAAYLRGVL